MDYLISLYFLSIFVFYFSCKNTKIQKCCYEPVNMTAHVGDRALALLTPPLAPPSNASRPIRVHRLPALNEVWRLHGCAALKLMQTFQIFGIFRQVLWISSSSWLNVASEALLKVILFIQWVLKEICVLYLYQNQTLKSLTLCSGLICSPVLIPRWTPLQFNKHS